MVRRTDPTERTDATGHTGTTARTESAAPVDPRALGLSAGIVWGGIVAFLELTADTEYGERWRILLADIYPGYSATPGDLAWGTTLGFLDAFLLGYLFGRLYNWLATPISG